MIRSLQDIFGPEFSDVHVDPRRGGATASYCLEQNFFFKKNVMYIWVVADVTMLHDTGISEVIRQHPELKSDRHCCQNKRRRESTLNSSRC